LSRFFDTGDTVGDVKLDYRRYGVGAGWNTFTATHPATSADVFAGTNLLSTSGTNNSNYPLTYDAIASGSAGKSVDFAYFKSTVSLTWTGAM
jgi:hypothetical protein